MLYQRKLLSDMSDIGEPGPLPQVLVGSLDDVNLADLSWLPPEVTGYEGQGFFPYAPPEPEPQPVIRWLHKSLVLQRIPAANRIAIRAAAQSDPIIYDFLDLLYQTDQVDLDNANLIAGLGYLVGEGLLTAEDVATIRA